VPLKSVIEEAAKLAAKQWTRFHFESGIPQNINLRDRLPYFSSSFAPLLSRRFPELRSAPPELILLIIAEGIELSGTISRKRIELQLGIVLPPERPREGLPKADRR